MKLKTKFGALTVALAMGAVALVGCNNNKGGNTPTPPPAPVTYYVTVNSGSWTVAGINTEGYLAGANVSFTVTPAAEREIVSVVANRDIGTLTPTAGQYSFVMPENNVSVTVTDRAVKKYALSLSGDLKVDAPDVEASLVFGTDPINSFTLSVLEGSEYVSVNEHTVHAIAAGDATLAASVSGQQVATLAVTVQASEIVSIKTALDAAIIEAPCNGRGGNNSKKTESSYTIAGKIAYKSKWKAGTSSGFDLDVIIDDGTEATILIIHSNKSTLAEAEAQAAYVVGDSVKVTCKFTNYYGLLEGIATNSDDTHQYSLYPDNLTKIEKTFATQYLTNATMTGAQLDAYAEACTANQSETAGAYTDIKYVTLENVTFDEDRDMDGPSKDVENGGFILAGSQYAINASEKSAIDIDEVDGHVSTLAGLLTGVNSSYKTTKMYAFSQTPLSVESVEILEGESKTIFLNNPVQLTYSTLPAGSYSDAVWVSSDPETVFVDENGLITGLKQGSATITLTVGGVSDTIAITVSGEQHVCTGVTLQKETTTLVKGASETLSVTISPDDCTDVVSWTSSDATVATVDQEGKVTAASDKTGTATITVTCGEFSDTCVVTVRAQRIADLADAKVGDPVDVYGYITAQYPVTTRNGIWVNDGNRGIYLYKKLPTGFSIGDAVHVVGAVAANHGGKQVSDTTFEKVTDTSGLNIQPASAVEITQSVISSITSELQGAKATVTGIVKSHSNINSTTASHTIVLTVGNEEFKVYGHKDNDGATVLADLARAAVGTEVTISGFVTANKSNCTDFTQLAKTDYQLIRPTLDNVVAPTATGFTLNKSEVGIKQGETFTLVATATPAGSELPAAVSYAVTGGTVADGKVTVDANTGVITVAADAEAGKTAIITATCGELTAQTCTVTVKDASAQPDFELSTTLTTGKYVIGALGNSNSNNYYYLPKPTQAVEKNPATAGPLSDPASELAVENAWDVTVDANNHIVISYTSGNTTYYLEATNAAQGIKIVTQQTANSYWTLNATGLQFNDGGTRYLATYNDGSFRYYSSPLQSGQSMANVFYHYIGA